MNRIAALQRKLISSLEPLVKFQMVLGDLCQHKTAGLGSTMKNMLNKDLKREFQDAGLGAEAENIDFYAIIDAAVKTRAHVGDSLYDDLFQEVAMNFMNRNGDLKKSWIPKIIEMKESNRLTSLHGFLLRASQNYVKDISRKLVDISKREISIVEENEEEGGFDGFDLNRNDVGHYDDQASAYSAKQLYQLLLQNLKWDKSKEILKILIDNGIVGFLGNNANKRSNGVQTVAKEMGVTVQVVSQYYVPKFRKDITQALGKIDLDQSRVLKKMFASVHSHNLVQIISSLDNFI